MARISKKTMNTIYLGFVVLILGGNALAAILALVDENYVPAAINGGFAALLGRMFYRELKRQRSA